LTFAQTVVREPVEEVVAVVDRTPILKSDIDLVAILGLTGPPIADDDRGYRSRLLDARIRLEVQFRDLESSGVLYRLDLDVVEVRRELVAGAGGEETVHAELAAVGLAEVDIDELALRISAANAYAEQRLRPRVTVSLQEIETAYRNLAVELETQGEVAPPLTSVHDQLHRVIAERKLNDEIERWLTRASEGREITRFNE
jgi:hypothetical protein